MDLPLLRTMHGPHEALNIDEMKTYWCTVDTNEDCRLVVRQCQLCSIGTMHWQVKSTVHFSGWLLVCTSQPYLKCLAFSNKQSENTEVCRPGVQVEGVQLVLSLLMGKQITKS